VEKTTYTNGRFLPEIRVGNLYTVKQGHMPIRDKRLPNHLQEIFGVQFKTKNSHIWDSFEQPKMPEYKCVPNGTPVLLVDASLLPKFVTSDGRLLLDIEILYEHEVLILTLSNTNWNLHFDKTTVG